MASEESAANCGETIGRLYQFLDGELTIDRRAQIQRHLEECSPCFQAVGFERELRVVIASKCRDRVPEDLMKRIKAALQDEEAD
ncbi:MAG: mycothiol system anti-sigma-R factor [Acidimicrobiales bacterium]